MCVTPASVAQWVKPLGYGVQHGQTWPSGHGGPEFKSRAVLRFVGLVHILSAVEMLHDSALYKSIMVWCGMIWYGTV